MGCWTQVSPGGPGHRGREAKGAFFFKGAPMPTDTRPSDRHLLYKSPPPRCVTVTRQYTQGARTNKHKSCHLLHHTYGTVTAERIDTPLDPQNPQYNRGPIIHMPYMSTTVQTSSAHCTYICIPLSVYTSTHEQPVSNTAVPRGAQAGQGAKRASGAL